VPTENNLFLLFHGPFGLHVFHMLGAMFLNENKLLELAARTFIRTLLQRNQQALLSGLRHGLALPDQGQVCRML